MQIAGKLHWGTARWGQCLALGAILMKSPQGAGGVYVDRGQSNWVPTGAEGLSGSHGDHTKYGVPTPNKVHQASPALKALVSFH